MPVRAGLADLIAEVRRLVGDPAGASAVFTDDDYQDALDRSRTFQQQVELEGLWDRVTSRYTVFSGPGAWETDAVTLRDYSDVVVVTPATVDLLAGAFTFDPGRTDSYLTATGYTYDVYGAASLILDWWIARVKNEYDVSVGGDSFSRSQKIENLRSLRDQMAGKAEGGRLVTTSSYRSDMTATRRRGSW